METLLRGILAGAFGGASIGPVAMWGGELWQTDRRGLIVVICGACFADLVIAVAAVAVASWTGVSLTAIHTGIEPFEMPGLLLAGIALVLMPLGQADGRVWSRPRRFAAAFGGTAILPGTTGLIVFWLAVWWRAGLLPAGFAPAYVLGDIGVWVAFTFGFSFFSSWLPFVIRTTGAFCIIWAAVKLAPSM